MSLYWSNLWLRRLYLRYLWLSELRNILELSRLLINLFEINDLTILVNDAHRNIKLKERNHFLLIHFYMLLRYNLLLLLGWRKTLLDLCDRIRSVVIYGFVHGQVVPRLDLFYFCWS